MQRRKPTKDEWDIYGPWLALTSVTLLVIIFVFVCRDKKLMQSLTNSERDENSDVGGFPITFGDPEDYSDHYVSDGNY